MKKKKNEIFIKTILFTNHNFSSSFIDFVITLANDRILKNDDILLQMK